LKGGLPVEIRLGDDAHADISAVPIVEMPQAMKTAFEQYFSGAARNVELEVALHGGTPFERRVWQAAAAIPRGETRSYGALAESLGKSAASARAVGSALRKNPFPLVYPCHRVVMSDGGLGGFSCGVDVKRRLLHLEGAYADRSG
jgi:O-6-methylguanine DNA methyltransferase